MSGSRALDLISRSASVKDAVGVLGETLSHTEPDRFVNLSSGRISFDSLTFGYGPVFFIPQGDKGNRLIFQLTDTSWNLVSDRYSSIN